ncbi:MAG: anaerobic ribonucleoside-triphosphate reductase activating protein [Candidatus Undinarchaeales archaeon]|jgi:pyruvate formate lyase activating enzyme|nr:anaerobic ribonucleoside-triphosphate reductase activating protein [Candidatus Undinarchaeales archaeon]MDP7491890.1 anaerobic ribonucleoside-triphosphate reductase activating protein [Candidatus Undinarchaeales archaeon]
MKIAGLQRFSLIEYPGKLSAVVFTQGCNLRCGYCHNPELVDPERFHAPIPEAEVLSFLGERRGKLDAVTVTGGEPLLHRDLDDFLDKVKRLGYLVKLDTNGSFPDRLARVISSGLVDYVAMDVKGPLDRYGSIVRKRIDKDRVLRSIATIIDSGIDHEFRTTVVGSQLKEGDLMEVGAMVRGARRFFLQGFRPSSKLLDPDLMDARSPGEDELRVMKEVVGGYVASCQIR